jgi:hypothetical protein
MIITDYCAPSGHGTPMFSRRGQSTIPQYVCFQGGEGGHSNVRQSPLDEIDEDSKPDLTIFKKEYDEIHEKQTKINNHSKLRGMDPKNSESRANWLWKIRENSSRKTSSFLAATREASSFNKKLDKTSRPPCNKYKPSYNMRFR